MSKKVRLLVALFLPLAVLLLAGCPERTTIAQIKQDPGHYHDKEVVLRGHVTESYGVLAQGVYELDDGTGRLWVLVEKRGVPRQGAEVEVVGRVISGVSFSGRDYGTGLREIRHRTL